MAPMVLMDYQALRVLETMAEKAALPARAALAASAERAALV